ncbi:MAG TPA: histidine kinase N-terminal 7TM domain-containing protein [Anaerolineales bacterium]|nr:histidine kinase N-terminal 7TM domain-containing protein [Anaerolineales bacterium]
MTWYVSNVALLSFFTTLFALAMAMAALRRQRVAGGLSFGLLMLAAAEWSFANGLELAVQQPEAKILWARFQYFGITSLPVFWFFFVLEYTHQAKWLKRPYSLLIWLIPLLTIVAAWTNDVHGWLWTQIVPATSEAGSQLVYGHGWVFWVFAGYGYLLILAGTLALVWAIFRYPRLYRRQAVIVLSGAAVPWLGNAIYLSGLSPVRGIDPTPLSFALSGLLYSLGIFRFHLFELVPVAREAIVEMMADGVVVLDKHDRVLDINPAAQEMLSVSGDVVGQDAAAAFANTPDLLACCCEEGQRASACISISDTRSLDVSITTLQSRGDVTAGRLIVMHDITQLRRTSEQLRLQSVALEAAASAIAILDRQGVFVWVNPAFTRLTGYAMDELKGQTPRLLKSGKHDDAYYQALWQTILAGQVWHGETINRRKDGTLYTEEQTIAPVQDDQGEIAYFISVKQDISERKQVEKLRDDLAHTMVHDLRNPLGNVMFAVDVLSQPNPPTEEERATLFKVARASGARMMDLLDAILEVTRLETGQMPLNPAPVDLADLITGALKMQSPLSKEKGIHLSSDLLHNLPPVNVDHSVISRVLQNLIGNAIKFTPSGGEVRVGLAQESEGGMLCVSIRDNGPGIAGDMIAHIFSKFVTGRVEGSGSGLGLAFCRLAVEAHRGHIWVESEPGQGSVFYFTLPVYEEA